MTTRKLALTPAVLSARALEVLCFLFGAHPLPLSTTTITRAVFLGRGQRIETASKRCWELLSLHREAGLLSTTVAATTAGRPPAHWGLTRAGIRLLLDTGRISEADVAAKPTSHKSAAALLARRRHDLHVFDVAAACLFAGRTDDRVTVEELVTDHSSWREVTDANGETHSVAPDLVAVVRFNTARVVLFFEVQGTAPRLEAVADKIRGFRCYLTSGAASQDYDARHFRILFTTFSDDPEGGIDHCHNVVEAAGEFPDTAALVYGAPVSLVVEQGVMAPVFLRLSDFIAWKGLLPEPLQAVFAESRHAANRVRMERDRRLGAEVPGRRWYE